MKKIKLSKVYKRNSFYVLAYEVGWNDELELTDKTFTTYRNALEVAKNTYVYFVKRVLYIIKVTPKSYSISKVVRGQTA